MFRTLHPTIWIIFALMVALYWHGGKNASAQTASCDSGTLPANCTYLPMLANANVAGVEVGATSTPTTAATIVATTEPTPSPSPTATQAPELTPTAVSTPVYVAVPVDGPPTDRVPSQHGDLNLSLRSYTSTNATLELVDNNGPSDSNAPQLAGLFAEPRLPLFSNAYQVHDWDWACGENGCRDAPLSSPPVTALEMITAEGEAIHIPTRNPQIYAGGYKVLVLYAEAERITLTYLREDTVAFGYAVHIEKVAVEPELLALYQRLDVEGRGELPGLRNGDPIGTAIGTSIIVAIRDRGTFMEPRSRKDWWRGF